MHPQGTPDFDHRRGRFFCKSIWDRKVHPTKASQQEFLATCIDVDLEKNRQCISHRTVEHIDKSAKRNLQLCLLKNVTIYPRPPTLPFLKRPFLTDFKKHTIPPPNGTKFWRIGPKSSQNPGKVPKPTVLAHDECPREICAHMGPKAPPPQRVSHWASCSFQRRIQVPLPKRSDLNHSFRLSHGLCPNTRGIRCQAKEHPGVAVCTLPGCPVKLHSGWETAK